MSSDPRAFSAALYSFQLVVRYFGLAGAFIRSVYPRVDSAHPDRDLCNKAELRTKSIFGFLPITLMYLLLIAHVVSSDRQTWPN